MATVAIFLPRSCWSGARSLLVGRLRGDERVRRLLAGATRPSSAFLLAALITPVATTAIRAPLDAVVAAGGALAIATRRVPPIVVVAACALIGEVAARLA